MSNSIIRCPSWKGTRPDRAAGYGPLYYGVMCFRGRDKVPNAPADSSGRARLPVRLAHVRRPARTVLLADVDRISAGTNYYFHLKNVSTYNRDFGLRHGGNANVLFVGGNVSSHPAAFIGDDAATAGDDHDLNIWLRNSARSISGPFPFQGVLDFD